MGDRYTPAALPSGTILQGGLPKSVPTNRPYSANGLLLRGVVMATYEVDNANHPQQRPPNPTTPVCIYCDVLTYSSMQGRRWGFLPQVLVLQKRTGLHSGHIWKPRATVNNITGNPLNANVVTSPADMDGDHVLVGFLDDNLSMPVILGSMPHPSADVGSEDAELGHRLNLKVADGDPDFITHKGIFYGIHPSGDFIIDTRLAYAEDLVGNGKEPNPPEDGSAGNLKINMQLGAKVTITINEEPALEIDLSGSDAKLNLGDGAKHVVLGEALQNWLDTTMKNWVIAHTHPTGMGPSGAPIEAGTYPSYDTAITSTKMALPNG